MAPHRNHVEARASRIPARQYVSETHDHKPDAMSARLAEQHPERTRTADDQFYRGQQFMVLEIEAAHRVLGAAIKTLRENFDARNLAEVKLAAESITAHANRIGPQIATLSKITAEKFGARLNRRSRV